MDDIKKITIEINMIEYQGEKYIALTDLFKILGDNTASLPPLSDFNQKLATALNYNPKSKIKTKSK